MVLPLSWRPPEGVYSQIGRRTIECSRLQELMDSITFWKVALTT